MSSVNLSLLIFLLAILIPACASSSLAFCTMQSSFKVSKQGDNIQPWHYSFPNLEPVHCSMSGSNCCFLSFIQVSQEAGKVVWYSHLFKNIPQFVVIHTVKGFRVVSEAEIGVFFGILLLFLWAKRCWQFFSMIPLLFLNPPCTSRISQFTYCWSLAWRILSIPLLACEMSAIVQ